MSKYPAIVWTPAMDAQLRTAYLAGERGGVLALAATLGLNPSCLTYRAKQLGLLVPSRADRIVWTAAMDAEITRTYQAGKQGGNKALAYKLNLSPGLISARAAKLGLPPLSPNGERPSSWSARDKAIVLAHLGEPIAQIRARLYRAGGSRSLNAIKHLICQERALGNWPTLSDQVVDRDQWLLPDVARGLGIKEDTVGRWVSDHGLRTVRYGGGGHRAIAISDLCNWLRENAGLWDHRKADHFFIIDVLTYTKRRAASFAREDAA